jgi:hypothetical protein
MARLMSVATALRSAPTGSFSVTSGHTTPEHPARHNHPARHAERSEHTGIGTLRHALRGIIGVRSDRAWFGGSARRRTRLNGRHRMIAAYSILVTQIQANIA